MKWTKIIWHQFLAGYEQEKWFKSKDNHKTALFQLQIIYSTIEERDALTKLHGASLSMQAWYDAIISKVERSLTKYKVKNPTSQIEMKDLLESGFLMGIQDGAVHNELSNKNSGIGTYSITLVSHNLIMYLGISSRSLKLMAPKIVPFCTWSQNTGTNTSLI